VAGAKFRGFDEPDPLIDPVERAGSSPPAVGRVGVLLFAVLPESTLPGGAMASAFVKLPLLMMLKPPHS